MTRWSWLCAERGPGQWLRHDLPRGHTVFEGLFFGSVMSCLSSRAWEKGRKSFLIQVSLFLRWSWVCSSLFLRWSCVVQAGPEFIR